MVNIWAIMQWYLMIFCIGFPQKHGWEERWPKHKLGFDLVNEQLKELSFMDWLIKYYHTNFFVNNGCLVILCQLYQSIKSDVWTLKWHDDLSYWEKTSYVHHGDLHCLCVFPTEKLFLYDGVSAPCIAKHFKIIDLNTQIQSQEEAYFSDVQVDGLGGYYETFISPFGSIKSTEEEDYEVWLCMLMDFLFQIFLGL